MRYSFSSEYLKVTPPSANFGEAWEALCHRLLQCEFGDQELLRLAPPDRGIDIVRRATGDAYQCKSNERGVFGSIEATPCCQSFDRAFEVRSLMGWQRLNFCINAPLTGDGFNKICEHVTTRGFIAEDVIVLGPDYWNDLCEKHTTSIENYFDYRIFVTESQVREALKKARYYDSFVKKAMDSIAREPLSISITNNRCPATLVIPFSGELTVEQLIDTAMSLYGVSLDWANFPELGTSCGPSVSLTTDRKAHSFKMKIRELSPEERAKLQLWIKLVWKDSLADDKRGYDGQMTLALLMRAPMIEAETIHIPASDRGAMTLRRTELLIQATIWKSLTALR